MMYEEIIKALRICTSERTLSRCSKLCPYLNIPNCKTHLMRHAAEAIEELNKPKWIPVTETLPEESEGLKWHEDMMIRFTSVWCCDAKNGIVGERYRLQEKVTVDGYTVQHPNWKWSKELWEPTHWMPIAPPTELPKEEKT